jgi:hypothetical protein
MCFNWSERTLVGQPDALEQLAPRFGPILAPWIWLPDQNPRRPSIVVGVRPTTAMP